MSVEQEILQSVVSYHASGDLGAFKIDASLEFRPDFPAFQGHFPGNPILPGIVQLACVRILAARFLERQLFSSVLSNIKFRDMVRPGQSVDITLSGEEENGIWNVRFNINSSEAAIATGDMQLEAAENMEAC